MNELQVFKNSEILGQEFKIYGDVENPLFLAKSVAEWIEHSDISTMLRTVDEDEKETNIVCTLGGNQEMWFLTEDGLYEVLMQSRKPKAKDFKKQVKFILKDIRKHGAYATPAKIEEMLLNPDIMIKTLQALKIEQEKRKKLETEKAWISEKREATAMNTASQKAKEVKKLKIELDKSKEYASIKNVERATGGKFSWKLLRNFCTGKELEIKKVFDQNYGSVNSYPAEAWEEIYAIDLKELF